MFVVMAFTFVVGSNLYYDSLNVSILVLVEIGGTRKVLTRWCLALYTTVDTVAGTIHTRRTALTVTLSEFNYSPRKEKNTWLHCEEKKLHGCIVMKRKRLRTLYYSDWFMVTLFCILMAVLLLEPK